jgi:hypothetical protein
MSKLLHTLAAVVIVALGSASFADGDDLFSDVRTNSVFDSDSSGNTNSGTTTTSPKRITRPEEVREMLKSAGFEAKVASSQTVTTEKKLAPWTFPVMVILSEDETSLTIVLGLNTIKDVSQELSAKTLLKMMIASQENAPALFAYHAKRERTELSMVMKNRRLTGQLLRDAVNRLAILAKSTDKIWALNTEKPAPADPKTGNKQRTPTTAATLVGKWSAARSATEAFAVEFTANGTFNLVYINNGKQTKSTGKFTVTAGSLSLVGDDGLKLEGKLTRDSDTQFSLAVRNSRALVFKKAK